MIMLLLLGLKVLVPLGPFSLINFSGLAGMELEAQKRMLEISLNALRAMIQGGGRTIAERVTGEFRRHSSKLK